ncbi:MAG: threonine--tRNA ligase [Holosporales bacterium]|jgi:threonyl-tRNA synthetase|nr:threonine--tRNA ligase [Holosporales bacterium]
MNRPVVAKLEGVILDLSRVGEVDGAQILTTNDKADVLPVIRHGAAHVMAMALKEIDPGIELAIGPVIENGFYYDFKSKRIFTVSDFEEIEKVMRDIVNAAIPFKREELSSDEAIKLFSSRNEPFKVELIRDLGVPSVGIYSIGDFIDLCKGPHVPDTSFIQADAFKLMSVAGAYWRGNSSNDMLQRIYGTAWLDASDMAEHLRMVKEAEARDHRKLGPELDIFNIYEEAVGSIFWLKNGCVLFNLVKEYIAQTIKKHGYFQVQTPQLLSRSLWETSGHWDKFRENMFIVAEEDNRFMAVKPMNCPGHILIYKNGSVKSYRDLPIRMAEFGLCHRNESSGSLHGLMRLRAFMQDDGHIFCSEDQIVSETQNFCSLLKEVYAKFGFADIAVKFSDRPEKRVGSDESWDIAEKALREAADASGLEYSINKGEGAFYGPKLEFVLKDCIGRDWQCGTLQVDFNLPQRFDIGYIDSDGSRKCSVMLHRAVVGSLERFIGILIENYAGKFPFWLSPVQMAVTSITEEAGQYAASIHNSLLEKNFRSVLDIDNEKITYKIRKHSVRKIPAIVIVGKKEMESNTISIRKLGSNETETISVDQMLGYFGELCK